MQTPSDEEIRACLIGVISDGFNRSINALRDSHAIDTAEMDRHYKGVGSPYYDLVTNEIACTAEQGAMAIKKLFSKRS